MSYEFLNGSTILVTGATGSFGQKCIQALLGCTEARRIIIFSRDELKQSQMVASLNDPAQRLRFFIGDVRDKDRLERALHGVDYVIHAAALKQVPALEYNPFEAVKTNILGTQNIIDAAIDQGVKKVVLLSSDKAANPSNLYGATKLCAEKLFVSGNSYGAGRTCFAAVRYGNVLGSRGSILNIIEEQRAGGKITLTHKEMTRFWITLDQSVNLVLMALEKMRGGEIYVPKIPSMKVHDLIRVLAPECSISVIGIRSGEKLHEVLITSDEARHTCEFDGYYVILPENKQVVGESSGAEEGNPLPDNFCLTSQTNTGWLEEEQIKKLLELS